MQLHLIPATDMNYTHTNAMGGQCPSIFCRLVGWLAPLLVLAALTASASAQTATVTGRVSNQGTGAYLKYAQVQVVGTDKSAVTEEDGSYTLANVPAGEVKLSVTYTGLDTQEVTVTVPAQGTIKQDISMTTADYGDVVKLGAFSVSGAREGNAKAIVEQRTALNFKTVVAADAFGDVAEGNVGEFLKLQPGVSVDYVDNDVRSTRIRGLPPKYNTTTIDGHPIANAASSSIVTGRQLELEQVSMAALDIIETTKTPTPDMMTPNLAGNVNAISKSAFDQKGASLKYQGSVNFNQWNGSFAKSKGWDEDSHNKALPGGKVEWSDTFLDGKLGIITSIAHSGAYADQRVTIGSQTWDKNPYNNDTELPLTTQWNFQDGAKPTWRDSLLMNVDYKVTDDLKLSLRTNYGYYRAEPYNRNWLVNANTAGATYDTTGNLLVVPAGLANRNETSEDSIGGLTATTSYARVLGSNQRKSGGTFITSPAVSWKHDNIKVDADASFSEAKNAYTSGQDGFFSLVQADYQGIGWHADRTANDNVHITQTSSGLAGSILDLGNYTKGGQVNNERRNSKDRMWTANADVQLDYSDWNVPTTFKVGVADSLEVRNIHNFQAKWTMTLTSGPTTGTAINLGDYPDPYLDGVGTVTDINGVTSKAPSTDKWALYRLFQSYGNTDPMATTANGPFAAQVSNNLRYLLQNVYDIKENIEAAYAMTTIKPIKHLTIIAGLRFERTATQGRSFDDKGGNATLLALGHTTTEVFAATTQGGLTTTAKTALGTTGTQYLDYIYYRYGSRVTRDKDYTNALPVIQARYEVSKNLILRGAYYASLLRPDFQSVVGGITATDNSDGSYAYSINNTTLKPETADNYDASVEYYFEPVGVVSATLFYKDVKNIQITPPAIATASATPDIQALLTEAGYTASDLSNPNSTVTTIINGPKTSLWGYELAYSQELSFLPSVFKGLGVTANFSHYHPEENRIWVLVPNAGDGMALNQGNLILRYKAGKFKTQVTGTWTAKRLYTLSGMNINSDGSFTPTTTTTGGVTTNVTNSNVSQYLGSRWVISANAEYQVHRYATIFVGVNNLFNSAKFNYNERSVFTTRNGNYGASINIGVKGSF